ARRCRAEGGPDIAAGQRATAGRTGRARSASAHARKIRSAREPGNFERAAGAGLAGDARASEGDDRLVAPALGDLPDDGHRAGVQADGAVLVGVAERLREEHLDAAVLEGLVELRDRRVEGVVAALAGEVDAALVDRCLLSADLQAGDRDLAGSRRLDAIGHDLGK